MRDESIAKLEHELASKTLEISETKDELSKRINDLKEANHRLKMRIQTDSTDGRRGETTVVKSSEVHVQSIPDRPKQFVQESITSSKKRQMSLEDHDVHRLLENAHKEPVASSYRRDSDRRDEFGGTVTSYGANTRDYTSEVTGLRDTFSSGASARDTFSVSAKTPYGKQTSEEECRIEDIEAELTSLREDLARTREARNAKTDVKYVSEESPSSRTRTASSERGVDSDQGRGGGGKRMVITTASYARVPRQDSTEYRNRQGSPDKKVSNLIQMFDMPSNQSRNSHKRANSEDKLSRRNKSQRSRGERAKSAIDFEAWKRVLIKKNQWN